MYAMLSKKRGNKDLALGIRAQCNSHIRKKYSINFNIPAHCSCLKACIATAKSGGATATAATATTRVSHT